MAETSAQATIIRTERGLTIAGTRITLYDVLDYLHADWPPRLIQHWLNLSDAQMADVMQYIAAHRAEVEAEYWHVIEQAEAVRTYWEERNRARVARIATLPPKPGQEALVAKLRARKARLGLS